MPFNLSELLADRDGENFQLHCKYLNPQLAKVVKTLGFDRFYERGEGCYLYDEEGPKYLDLLSGFGVFALGRSHPVVRDALHQALDADLPNMVQMDCALLPGLLAEQLVTRSPDQIERVYFCNSGAEAVEASIKFARAHTGRQRICYQSHAYHGLTMGALSLNGSEDFKKGFGDMLPGATEYPSGTSRLFERRFAAVTWRPSSWNRFRERRLRTRGRSMASARSGLSRGGRSVHLRRSSNGHRAHRQVLRLRALRASSRHRHRFQGALGWLRSGGGDAHQRQDLS